MKTRKYNSSFSIPVTDEMYQQVQRTSDGKKISKAEFLRPIIEGYLKQHQPNNEK